MANVTLYRMKPARMGPEAIAKLARKLEIDAKPVASDDAVAVRDDRRTLVYAQPCSRMGGVLFYTDQAASLGAPVKKAVDPRRAKAWADRFLEEFRLLPKPTDGKHGRFALETYGYVNEGVVFDGRSRKRMAVGTVVGSKATLDGLPVSGPRGRIKMIFKDAERPAFIHRGLWDALEPYEEREIVREHDAVAAVRGELERRRDCGTPFYDVVDVKLAYWADAFGGGPDLLAPSYFVEVEYKDLNPKDRPDLQGPRQLIRVPAYR
jgi:hypothetical protein